MRAKSGRGISLAFGYAREASHLRKEQAYSAPACERRPFRKNQILLDASFQCTAWTLPSTLGVCAASRIPAKGRSAAKARKRKNCPDEENRGDFCFRVLRAFSILAACWLFQHLAPYPVFAGQSAAGRRVLLTRQNQCASGEESCPGIRKRPHCPLRKGALPRF